MSEDFEGAIKEVEIASQEALRFVRDVAEVFLYEVLGHPEALITDQSLIYDFGPFESQVSMEEFEKEVILKTKAIFGVDITPVIEEYLPVIFHYIRRHRGTA